MLRAVSIHIGVNKPHGGYTSLKTSENNAWRMAQLANQAGYESLLVLRGPAATRQAVHDVLTKVSGMLTAGTTLFLSFSGHGFQVADDHLPDERSGQDQGWCLADGHLIDDKLAGYWRLFEPGVRILVVSESCYSGGVVRDDDEKQKGHHSPHAAPPAEPPIVWRGDPYYGGMRSAAPEAPVASCIGPTTSDDGIRASLLLLSASAHDQPAQEGLFAKHLFEVWNEGAFRGSYCDLHREIKNRVMRDRPCQEPQILPLGASNPLFPLETAFHLPRPGSNGSYGTNRGTVYRGEPVSQEPVLHW